MQIKRVEDRKKDWTFALCWMNAQLQLAKGEWKLAESLLHDMLIQCGRKKTNDYEWERRAHYCTLFLVSLYVQNERPKGALTLLAMAMKQYPSMTALWWLQSARVLIGIGSLNRAEECIQNCCNCIDKEGEVYESKIKIEAEETRRILILMRDGPEHAVACATHQKGNLWHENNAAVILAMLGKLEHSRKRIEHNFINDFENAMFEPIVSNLSLLFTLMPPSGAAGTKCTQKFGAWVAAAAPDDFDLACCKSVKK